MRPLLALSALARLVRSRGRDERQAIIFIRALQGRSERNAFLQFQHTEAGPRLLRERPSLLRTLTEANRTGRFEPGTLGHAYLLFMRQQGFTAADLMALAASPLDHELPEDEAFVQERARVMHDLWHAATGYDGSTTGEVCLMAFRLAQVPHLAFFLLTLGMLIKPPKHTPGAPVRRAILEGWRLGKHAAWLRGADWENLLPLDLATVRHQLRLRQPVVYQRVIAMNTVPGPATARDRTDAAASPSVS